MKILVAISLFTLFACSSKDQKMCDCLASGEKLNQFSAELLQKAATKEDVIQMQKLKADKTKKCLDYQTMSGEEMLKRKALCD